MPAVGGGGRGNAGKSTPAARRKQRRAASPTTTKVLRSKKPYVAPRSPGSDAAQRAGAQTQRKADARNRGRSDAAAPGGAGGYRLTREERKVRDEAILQARIRAQGRKRGGSGWRALEAAARYATERAKNQVDVKSAGVPVFLPTELKRLARGTAEATVEAPGDVAKNTARGFKDALVGAPGALVKTALETAEGTAEGDPTRGVRHSLKDYLKDAGRRYGPLLKEGGEHEFAERVKREGLSAEALDALGAVAGPGGAASRGVGAAARAGRLGERAKAVASEPRLRERTSGGESREQETSPAFFKAARQKRRDAAVFRGQQRVVERADRRAQRKREDGTTRQRGPVDAVVREATERGEVVPSKITGLERRGRGVGVRRAPSKRKIQKRERVDFARRKGQALQAQRRDQRQEGVAGGGRGAGRAYASLSPAEKVAYKAAIQGARTPSAGKAWAEARIRRIKAAIKRGDVDEADARELPALRALAAEPDKHFTANLARVAEEEVERGKRVAREDPRLGETPEERETTGELRRRAPQFTILGVKRKGRTTAAAERAARERRDRARKDRARGERRMRTAERKVGAAEETARRLDARARGRLGERARKVGDPAETAWFKPRPDAKNPPVGRGFIDRDGNLHTWDEAEGTHLEMARARGVPDANRIQEQFLIRSDGTIAVNGGTGRMDDFEIVARAIAQDPRLKPPKEWDTSPDAPGPLDATGKRYPNFATVLERVGGPKAGHGAIGRAERAVELHRRATLNHRRRANKARTEKAREAHTKLAEAAADRAVAAQKRLDALEGAAAQAPAEAVRLRKRVVAARSRREEVAAEIKRAEEEVKAAAKEGRAAAALRRRYGRDALDPRTAEPIPDFLERGRRAVDEAGLSEPGYFQSAPRESRRFSLFTTGGFRHVPRDRRYKGTLFEQGREDGSFTTYAQGLARNLKAKHNWRLVEDTIREHGFAWSRNRSVEEIRRELERRGIDESTVAFWNPGVFREAGQSLDVGEAVGRIDRGDRILDQPDLVGESLDVGQAQMAKAVELARDTGRWAESRDWIAVPKGLMDELEADTRPSHWFWRGLDVVKGKQARILLGTSPAWLQFQVASNMLLTTLAGVGPLEIMRAQRWWRRLSDEERAAIEPHVGVGHFHDSLDQVRIGAAANGDVLNAWRAMKAHDFWHKPRKLLRGGAVSQLNPLDALFRLDNAQNNAFRKAVLYNRLKRDAYKRMGENVSLQQRALDRLVGHFRYTRPEETMAALARDHRVIARNAEAVRDFLGDYNTFTARERRILGRSVMFYGFLRFSLRFAFYTMPVKHPVMTSIIGQLGQLQTEEVRRLLGGNELPWAMGRLYFSKGGKLESINVARANPFLNTVTELDLNRDVTDQLRNGLRFLPPVYVSLLDQAFSKSSFTNKGYRVEGETSERRLGDYGVANRARIFLNDMARLNAIYRSADKAASGGVPQGDDSLLGDRPTEFKRFDIRAGIAESAEKHEGRGGFWGAFKRDMLPLVPQPDDSVEVAQKVRESRGTAAPTQTAQQKAQAAAYAGRAPQVDEDELRRLLEAYGTK